MKKKERKAKYYYKDGTTFEGRLSDVPHRWDFSKILHRLDGPAVERDDGTKEWYLNGELHRKDGPAREKADGAKDWLLNGLLHRVDGPAVKYCDSGTKKWYLNGKLHREDGPAVEWTYGTKEWYQNGYYHREDGPAIEWSDGSRYWLLSGNLHREDGPAIEFTDGAAAQWWWFDKYLEVLSQEYLIRYMELTKETITSLLLSPNEILRESAKKYKWKELDND